MGDNDAGRPEYRLKNNCKVVKSRKAEIDNQTVHISI